MFVQNCVLSTQNHIERTHHQGRAGHDDEHGAGDPDVRVCRGEDVKHRMSGDSTRMIALLNATNVIMYRVVWTHSCQVWVMAD